MLTKTKQPRLLNALALTSLSILIASCQTTRSISTSKADEATATAAAKASTAEVKAVQAQTAVAQACPTLQAAQPVAPAPSTEMCAVFKPLLYHGKIAQAGEKQTATPSEKAYAALAAQAAVDNAVLLSFCPGLDPRHK